MLANKPPATAEQLDRCDVCGNKMHRSDLVRTQVEWLYPQHENYLSYSNYDGAFWVVDDAADSGLISYGNRCDNARTTLSDANVISYVNGVQTWEGDGTFRCTSVPVQNFADANQVIFSFQIGPHEQNTSPEMTVVIGHCATDGTNKTALKSFVISGCTKLWITWLGAESDSSYAAGNGCYYISVTNDGEWWIDELQLETDPVRTTPGTYVKTAGTIVGSTAEASSVSSRKVCPGCFEYVLKKSTKVGRQHETPVDDPVDTHNQEF